MDLEKISVMWVQKLLIGKTNQLKLKWKRKLIKIIIGVAIGIMLCSYYPSVVPIAKYKFLESGGARDTLVNTLKEIK